MIKKVCYIILILCFTSISIASDWTSYLQSASANFDIIDTFDHRDNWRPTRSATCSWGENQTNTPGDPDLVGINWGSYSFRSSLSEAERDWVIYDHTSTYQIGTKALMLGVEGQKSTETCSTPSVNYTGKQGAGSFKGYFGTPDDTSGSTGYTEIYIFMRVYLPSNSYPTAEEDLSNNIFKYISGQEYQADRGVGCKKINIGLGFTDVYTYQSHHDGTLVTAEGVYRYGDSENWLYMRPRSNNGAPRTLGGSLENRVTSGFLSTAFHDAWSDISDELGAVEIYAKLGSDANIGKDSGQGDGLFKVWFYRADGTVLNSGNPVVEQSTCVFRKAINHKFNRLFFHSNHRTTNDSNSGDYYYKCGEGMDCSWWVDDIIIDDNRVGPSYFTLLDTFEGLAIEAVITSPTTDPTYSTVASTIDLDGTADSDGTILFVEWENNRGGSGVATGTTSWTVDNIPLLSGENIITITVTDNDSNSATDIITVTKTETITDFSEYTTGANLSDWTALWITNGTTYKAMQITAETDPVGTKQCEYIQEETGLNAIIWNDIGILDNADILMKVKSDYIDNITDGIRIYARANGSSGHENCYYVNFKADSFSINEYTNGVSAILSAKTANYDISTTSYIRFNLNGSALKAKIWSSQVIEPYDWLIETTDTTLNNGSIGFGAYNLNTDYEIDYFGVVTW